MYDEDGRDEEYRTCCNCAHVQLCRMEEPVRCENCGEGAAWACDTLEDAEEESQAIIDRDTDRARRFAEERGYHGDAAAVDAARETMDGGHIARTWEPGTFKSDPRGH